MLKHLVPMMKKMARPLLARRGAAQYPEHDLALAATFLWVIERHSGILFLWGVVAAALMGQDTMQIYSPAAARAPSHSSDGTQHVFPQKGCSPQKGWKSGYVDKIVSKSNLN